MLYPCVSLYERPAAAASAGFASVESWWPFTESEPTSEQVDRFVDSFLRAEVEVASLNFLAGRRSRGEKGLASRADGVQRFLVNVPLAVNVATRIGARAMNVLYGNTDPAETAEQQLDRAAESIRFAAEAAGERGIRVMVEPVCAAESPDYALRTIADVRRVIDAVKERGGPSVGVCYDIYHLAQEDPGVFARIAEDCDLIAHVQLADLPGRGAPGTGTLPIPDILTALAAAGYGGFVGLEYRAGARG
jgi:hydroxypyruvate isomerase